MAGRRSVRAVVVTRHGPGDESLRRRNRTQVEGRRERARTRLTRTRPPRPLRGHTRRREREVSARYRTLYRTRRGTAGRPRSELGDPTTTTSPARVRTRSPGKSGEGVRVTTRVGDALPKYRPDQDVQVTASVSSWYAAAYSTKFRSSLRPVSPLFSGWNCVPITFPASFAAMAAKSNP